MTRLWKSLALSLGVMVTGARGQEVPRPSPPAATIGRPVAQIGRPVVLTQQTSTSPFLDPQLRPVSFAGENRIATIVRGASPDATMERPSISTRSVDNVNPTMFAWRAPSDEPAPKPQTLAPPLASSGPISSGPISSGPIISESHATAGDCGGCSCGSSCGSCCDSNHCSLFSGCDGLFGLGRLGIGRWCSSCDHCAGSCSSSCFGDCGETCDDCYPGNRFWVSGEYLLWSSKGSPTPPLVTAAVGQGDRLTQGAVGPNSTVLFGGDDVGGSARSGARFRAGYWFCDDHLLGIDGGFFFLGDKNGSFTVASDGTNSPGNPILARPATYVAQPLGFPAARFGNLLGPNRELAAGDQLLPNRSIAHLAGVVNVGTSSSLWGAEANLRTNLCCGPCYFVDLIGGFRSLSLDESLSVSEVLNVTSAMGPVPAGLVGTTFVINDTFSTKNRFNGGQFGAAGEWRRGRWSLGLDAKLGLGNTEQTVDINGFTTTSPGPGGPAGTSSTGGFLTRALPPGTGGNIGHFTRDQFSVVPEFTLTLGYQLSDHVRCFAGYNYLYWTNVARPGNQIDTVVDPNQNFGQNNPGMNRPTFMFRNSDYWAQGLTAGLEFRW